MSQTQLGKLVGVYEPCIEFFIRPEDPGTRIQLRPFYAFLPPPMEVKAMVGSLINRQGRQLVVQFWSYN